MTLQLQAALWSSLITLSNVCVVVGTSTAGESAALSKGSRMLVYVGTYTRGTSKSEGIYRYRFDPGSGALSHVGVTENDDNPSFLALHPNGRLLYAVAEIGEGGSPR